MRLLQSVPADHFRLVEFESGGMLASRDKQEVSVSVCSVCMFGSVSNGVHGGKQGVSSLMFVNESPGTHDGNQGVSSSMFSNRFPGAQGIWETRGKYLETNPFKFIVPMLRLQAPQQIRKLDS